MDQPITEASIIHYVPNRPARPTRYKYCMGCGAKKPRSEFYDHPRTWDRKHTRCADCHRAAGRARYHRDPELHQERSRASRAKRRQQQQRNS